MQITLFGNPNSGKTTLFNLLTGSSLKVGNFPGVTVEGKTGKIKNTDISVFDLPGTYSLEATSEEEKIAVRSLIKDTDVIVNVVDSLSLARGLYLTHQLIAQNTPVILALNMTDELEKQSGKINTQKLSSFLGIPVFAISAKKNIGIDALMDEIRSASGNKKHFRFSPGEDGICEIYAHIDKILPECFTPPKQKNAVVDKILTGKFSIPCFLLIMALILYLTFFLFAPITARLIESFTEFLSGKVANVMATAGTSEFLIMLVRDGIFAGVGSVLAFLPCVVFLAFFISLLEDCGYMARVAFIMDAPMRFFGFSGKSIVPIVMGLGCSVPAVMACRTLTEKRKNTALSLPFVSCPAKLPVFFMLASALFVNPVAVILFLYLLGFVCCFANGKLSPGGGEFLLELPPYRMPKAKNVFSDVKKRAGDFFSRAFGIIFVSSLAVFLLASVSFSLEFDRENSILSSLAKFLLPLFKPMGISSWRVLASLFAGIGAKEAILSSMSILSVTASEFTCAGGFAFLVFCSLYSPCASTLAVIKREYGFSSAARSFFVQTLVAYVLATVSFLVLSVFM